MSRDRTAYPATLEIEYPATLNRLTTFFRLLLSIPIIIVLGILSGSGGQSYAEESTKQVSSSGSGIAAGLGIATALLIIVRQRYPRWWFDFNVEFNRFSTRVAAYLFLLTDKYPSTVDKQSVHLDFAYPNVKKDLNRWLPLVKWLLALPHYVALVFLCLVSVIVTVIAWFSILFTGTYPRSLFDFVVGVGRWGTRVNAYAFLLTTDQYPPFSLK
ncbi:DUF4389 domain-containing protein [Polaromonas sp.]|nr:DUF4389 domain-containing protein [Candidatus Saccharibacteria bacterium]